MAALVLWAGNGYGVLEHSCEEHGKHQHILTNWINTSCEHDHHQDPESHEHQHTDSGFHTSHSEEQASFIHFYAETPQKTSVISVVITPFLQVALPYSFLFKATGFSSEIHISPLPTSVFRRTLGRSLLAWVQSFLI
ncbi:hypothetical protein [Runella sp.]|uniref:hypothetical protein n=1 Tax=Runella sp. TaxID=1960881 RepID=UPI003D149389